LDAQHGDLVGDRVQVPDDAGHPHRRDDLRHGHGHLRRHLAGRARGEAEAARRHPRLVTAGRSHIDLIAALLAGFVGLLALGVSIYGVTLQRQQIRAQVWPHVELSHENVPAPMSMRLDNAGVGPALIKRAVVTVDGRPVRTWDEALVALIGWKPRYITSYIHN